MADKLFPSSERDEGIGSSFLRLLPSLSGGNNRTAMTMGARGSITPPEIINTPNRPALSSENIVTKVGGKFLISSYPLSLSLGGRPVFGPLVIHRVKNMPKQLLFTSLLPNNFGQFFIFDFQSFTEAFQFYKFL